MSAFSILTYNVFVVSVRGTGFEPATLWSRSISSRLNGWRLSTIQDQVRTVIKVRNPGHSSDRQKLVLDFVARPHMCVAMAEPSDSGVTQVIELLLLEAGRIMEDASVDLALALPVEPQLLHNRIANLAAAAAEISSLAAAAQTLLRLRDRLCAD